MVDSIMSKSKIFVWLLASLTLTACGQKGALYLPESSTPVVTPEPKPADDSTQPVISQNPQNPNVLSTQPTDPATTATDQGTANDY